MTAPADNPGRPSPLRSPQRPGFWIAIALHFALCLGVYQFGLSQREMQQMQIEGPSHLIDAYVKAARMFGPLGVLRAYLRGESDERLYLAYARLLLEGKTDLAYIADRQNDKRVGEVQLPERAWPYRDVRVEYPPLAFLAVLPPALISTEYPIYRRAFAGFMLLLHFLNLWLAWQLLAADTPDPAQRWRIATRSAWLSLAFLCALGAISTTRMDHAVTSWILLTLLAFQRSNQAQGRARMTWAAATGALAAAGVMTKLVPGLAAAAAALLWLQASSKDRVSRTLAAALSGAVVLIVSNGLMYALAGEHYLDSFRYHTLRGVQIESTYAGLLMLARTWQLAMHVDESFGSTNLATCFTPLVRQLSPWLFVISAGYLCFRRRFVPDGAGALAFTCVLLLLFMLTNRVLSPQYLIWIGAPVVLLAAQRPTARALWWSFFVAVVLTQLIFPRGYPLLKALHPLAIALVNLRNLLLVLFCAGLTRYYSRALQRTAADDNGNVHSVAS